MLIIYYETYGYKSKNHDVIKNFILHKVKTIRARIHLILKYTFYNIANIQHYTNKYCKYFATKSKSEMEIKPSS